MKALLLSTLMLLTWTSASIAETAITRRSDITPAPTPIPGNAIQIENSKAGTAAWKLTNPAVQHEIEGYASLTSVNIGGKIQFFVHTTDPNYSYEVYRMGWYGGLGARRLSGPYALPGTHQPMPTPDAETGLVECDWKKSFELSIPNSGWVSGVYLVKLTAQPSGKQSYMIFVVRDDARKSAFLFQSSVSTYQAYNNWGGKSLYEYNSKGGVRAYKVSFNRPYALSHDIDGALPKTNIGIGAGSFLAAPMYRDSPTDPAGWEYPFVRWLEKESYDVSYSTSLDTHLTPNNLLVHRGFLSVGHDEYWSKSMRDGVEAARDRGVNLGFFSSNSAYWQVRFEPASKRQTDLNRTMVCYKDVSKDPARDGTVTTRWRDAPLNRPEDALIGVMYYNSPVNEDIQVVQENHWVFKNTGLKNGDVLPKLIGYEGDAVFGNAPKNTLFLTVSPQYSKYSMAVYDAPSGATVFSTGSMQWSWALDDYGVPGLRTSRLHPGAQQMTKNVLNRFLQVRPSITGSSARLPTSPNK